MNSFEIQGIWWVIENPENKLEGKLEYSNEDGMLLSLTGNFGSAINQDDYRNLEIIQGYGIKGERITIIDSLMTNYTNHIPGIPISQYTPNEIFINAHFDSKNDIKIDASFIEFNNVDLWAGVSGFKIKDLYSDTKTNIEYILPDSIELLKDKDFDIYLDFYLKGFDFNLDFQANIELNQIVKTRIDFKKSIDIEFFRYISNKIQKFYSFVTTQPVYPINVEFICDSNELAKIDYVKFKKTISYFYNESQSIKSRKKIKGGDTLFRVKDNTDNIQNILKNWFERYEIIKPSLDLYFSNLYSDSLYVNNIFINYIQSLESYHRRTDSQTELPEEQHLKKLASIITVVDDEHKEWLKQKLHYSNEISLRKRMKLIFNKYEEILNLNGNGSKIIDKLLSTRNYFTHFDEINYSNSYKNHKIYYASKLVEIILKLCFLSEMGLDIPEIHNILKNQRNILKGLHFYIGKLIDE